MRNQKRFVASGKCNQNNHMDVETKKENQTLTSNIYVMTNCDRKRRKRSEVTSTVTGAVNELPHD